MKSISKKLVSLLLVALMLASTLPAFAEGAQKWTETDMPDGWTKVENEGGATLGYSKKSGLGLVYADGYAFKDLNKDGDLDVYEDWRVDYTTRAQALVDSGLLTTEWMMGLKMNTSFGGANKDALSEDMISALKLGYRYMRYTKASPDIVVKWNNMIQEYIEAMDFVVVPATWIDDPLGGNGVSNWPGYLGLTASFDPTLAAQYGEMLSEEWRALGITMKVAPQMDLATEPRWKRTDLTFGEDPQLSMDMAQAMVNAWQSTYDEEGNDLGWGEDSVNCQVKHLTGDGAAESGRESHSLDGAYNVFPGDQFYTHLLPFLACQNLPGKTGKTSSAMTNFSVALDGYGEPIGGERVASSFNHWKMTEVWREMNNWDGYILTDWSVHNSKYYGVEDLTIPERLLKVLEAGCDGFGNLGKKLQDDVNTAMEVYALGVAKYGQEEFDALMNTTTRRTLKPLFNVGIIDNPYLTLEAATTIPKNAEHVAAAFDAQVRSVVMLKNSDNLIKQDDGEKKTVYIPWKFTAAVTSGRSPKPASFAPTFDLQTALKYFNVVTDKPGQPTGEAGTDGKATYTENDIVRATAEEIAACDFALLRIKSPQNANPTTGYDSETNTVPETYEYLPISLQYRPYTADSMYVRFESIGGQIVEKEIEGIYDTEIIYEKENRSYYGKTGLISNEKDLDFVLYAASVCDKVVVAVDTQKPLIFAEFEPEVDTILVAWSGDRAKAIEEAAFLDIVAGKAEPSALLPLQMPADMETVEEQYEDVPRDMRCYEDADGNTYDFAFGMNWAGVINDERVAKYYVDPISVDEITVQEYYAKD